MTQIADVLPDVLPISREKAQTAADLVQGLDSPALEWLAGFMAGAAARGRLAAPQAATPVAIATGAAVQQQLTIVYGSQTGNAKRVAEKLAAEVKSTGLPVRIVRADAYRTSDLKKEKFLYLVISTHSEGDDVEPPDDARTAKATTWSHRTMRAASMNSSWASVHPNCRSFRTACWHWAIPATWISAA